MTTYLFLVTHTGYRSAMTIGDCKVFELPDLVEYVRTDGRFYKSYTIRVCVPNYGLINTKYMSLVEFNTIFGPYISEIGPLLVYRKGEYPIFKREIYREYGVLLDDRTVD